MQTLAPVPADLVSTREALHRVAEAVVSPARVRASGREISLTPTRGGFGTPPLPDGSRVRVEGVELVIDDPDGAARRAPLSSVRAAARFVGLEADALEDGPLAIAPDAAAFLAGFYAFADELLRTLHAEAGADAEPSPIKLWPEHFDVAFDLGAEASGARAGYGASPGDEHHPEPYLYVGPWTARPTGPRWHATGFSGAELTYAELVATTDPLAAALTFMRACRDELAALAA